jgi:hypothetical protein
MRWFRSNIRLGSRLALLALTIQFALSFGHFHGSIARPAPVPAGATLAADGLHSKPGSGEDPAGQPCDDCAICAVMALASAMLGATAPDLPAPQAATSLDLTADAGLVDLNPARGAFQARAPPIC